MTLKIVSNDFNNEIHSVRIDDGFIEVISIESGENVAISDMGNIFPGFKSIIETASSTYEILDSLTQSNPNYIWAHVSGKL